MEGAGGSSGADNPENLVCWSQYKSLGVSPGFLLFTNVCGRCIWLEHFGICCDFGRLRTPSLLLFFRASLVPKAGGILDGEASFTEGCNCWFGGLR